MSAGGQPPLRLTHHTRNKLRSRIYRAAGVTVDHVVDTVTSPEHVTPSERGRSNAWKQHDDGWLQVTHVLERGTIAIISATVKARGPVRQERQHEQDEDDVRQ
jgi:hypothetical protein